MFYFLYYGTMIILIPGLIFSIVAQILIKVRFSRYSKIDAKCGITAAETGRRLLSSHGCVGVTVQPIKGDLTDNYNPKTDVLSLSESVFDSSSIAALGVAAHECGHACQKYDGSLLLKLRSILVPITNIGSRLAVPLAVIGVIIEFIIGGTETNAGTVIIAIACCLYSLSTIFALVTLPVEFNASHRALRMLKEQNILDRGELIGAKRVLSAAAMTYVASLVISFLYLLRFLVILGSVRGNMKK